MTIERILKKLYRKNIPIIACEFSLEQFALGLRDSIDIKHGNKWHYGIKPPMRFYDQYIFSASPKQEQKIYENMLKRYYGLDHAQIIDKI
jgi:hypothetical protein